LFLGSLAEMGMTIIVSCSHPMRTEVFEQFDDLLLLSAHGLPVYCGVAAGIIDFLQEAGYSRPPGENPMDFALDVMRGLVAREVIKPSDLDPSKPQLYTERRAAGSAQALLEDLWAGEIASGYESWDVFPTAENGDPETPTTPAYLSSVNAPLPIPYAPPLQVQFFHYLSYALWTEFTRERRMWWSIFTHIAIYLISGSIMGVFLGNPVPGVESFPSMFSVTFFFFCIIDSVIGIAVLTEYHAFPVLSGGQKGPEIRFNYSIDRDNTILNHKGSKSQFSHQDAHRFTAHSFPIILFDGFFTIPFTLSRFISLHTHMIILPISFLCWIMVGWISLFSRFYL